MTPVVFSVANAKSTTDTGSWQIPFLAVLVPMTAIFLFIWLLTLAEPERVPRPLQPLAAFLRRYSGIEAEREAAQRGEVPPVPTYEQMMLLNPDGNPGLFAAMLASSQPTRETGAYEPRHARPAAPQPLPTRADLYLLRVEIALHLGFELDVHDNAAWVTRRQLRALETFCALRYETIQTPAHVLGRHGLALQVN